MARKPVKGSHASQAPQESSFHLEDCGPLPSNGLQWEAKPSRTSTKPPAALLLVHIGTYGVDWVELPPLQWLGSWTTPEVESEGGPLG